jgi:hypothetical protein
MTKAQYFEILIPIVEPPLAKLGFTFQKSKDSFIKKLADGWQKVQFDFYEFGLTYNINLGFIIRNNEVQEILGNYMKINPKDFKSSHTLILTLPALNNEPENVYEFNYPSEASQVINDKFITFLENDLPGLSKKFSSLENIFEYYYFSNNKKFVKSYDDLVIPIIISKVLNNNKLLEVARWSKYNFEVLRAKNPSLIDVELHDKFFPTLLKDFGVDEN